MGVSRGHNGSDHLMSKPAVSDVAWVAGVRLSHPDRLIYADLNFSKVQLARYHAALAPWVMPHVRGRPLTLVHCPAGIAGRCTYLKHGTAWGPGALRRVRIQERTKVGEYLVADTAAALVALTQMGVVEVHTWNSTADDLERPNRIVWDFDPGPDVLWSQTVSAARLLREVLKTMGLMAWVKTTGGRGLHVVVPLSPQLDWSQCLRYARDVSEAMVRADPALYTTTFSKQGRERKILIDYLRNNRTNTSICAYSPRARAGGPVSVAAGMEGVERRSGRLDRVIGAAPPAPPARRPWADYWTTSQRISTAALEAVRRFVRSLKGATRACAGIKPPGPGVISAPARQSRGPRLASPRRGERNQAGPECR
jgi:bifunctional non-homologous end joining protein LigD